MKALTQSADETLAILRLRQWLRDKSRVRHGGATRYQKVGWCERRARDADAAIVRVIDFETAFAMLTPQQQELLAIVYGHGSSREEAAALVHTSAHTVAYHLAHARRRLALILDRRGIL
jgi:DNA-directed RNA polymerase specialized sigma24 family protein